MSNDINFIDIKEFRELGILQELNRQFLHPLGLALEVVIEEDGTERLGSVWDYRDDPEGIHYALADKEFTNSDRLLSFKNKANNVLKLFEDRKKDRIEKLGFFIEPIPD